MADERLRFSYSHLPIALKVAMLSETVTLSLRNVLLISRNCHAKLNVLKSLVVYVNHGCYDVSIPCEVAKAIL